MWCGFEFIYSIQNSLFLRLSGVFTVRLHFYRFHQNRLNSQIDFMFQVCRRSKDCTFSEKMCASPSPTEGVCTHLIIARNLATWLKFNVKNATCTEIILVKFNWIQIIDKLDYLTHMSKNWREWSARRTWRAEVDTHTWVEFMHGIQKRISQHSIARKLILCAVCVTACASVGLMKRHAFTK